MDCCCQVAFAVIPVWSCNCLRALSLMTWFLGGEESSIIQEEHHGLVFVSWRNRMASPKKNGSWMFLLRLLDGFRLGVSSCLEMRNLSSAPRCWFFWLTVKSFAIPSLAHWAIQRTTKTCSPQHPSGQSARCLQARSQWGCLQWWCLPSLAD